MVNFFDSLLLLDINTHIIFLSALLYNLFFGLDQSDCPLPCATISTEVKFLSRVDQDTHGVDINIIPIVEVKCIFVSVFCKYFITLFLQVTTTEMTKSTLASFLSEVE